MKNKIKNKTAFLLHESSFWTGFGSALNIAGDYFDYNSFASDREVDRKALASDWDIVGYYFNEAKEIFENENEITTLK